MQLTPQLILRRQSGEPAHSPLTVRQPSEHKLHEDKESAGEFPALLVNQFDVVTAARISS
jgi:hypothetical protein